MYMYLIDMKRALLIIYFILFHWHETTIGGHIFYFIYLFITDNKTPL